MQGTLAKVSLPWQGDWTRWSPGATSNSNNSEKPLRKIWLLLLAYSSPCLSYCKRKSYWILSGSGSQFYNTRVQQWAIERKSGPSAGSHTKQNYASEKSQYLKAASQGTKSSFLIMFHRHLTSSHKLQGFSNLNWQALHSLHSQTPVFRVSLLVAAQMWQRTFSWLVPWTTPGLCLPCS